MNRKAGFRILLVAVAAVVCFLAGLAWILYGREFTLRIPEEKIQAELNRMFPIEKNHLLVFTLRYTNPRVRLEQGSDRVQAGLDAETLFKVNDRSFSGSATVSGGLRYEGSTGSFFLTDSRVERISITGFPEKYMDSLNGLASLLLRHPLDQKPVYRLNEGDVKQGLAMLVLKRVHVKDRCLEVVMGIGP